MTGRLVVLMVILLGVISTTSNSISQVSPWHVKYKDSIIPTEAYGVPRILFVESIDSVFFVLREQVFKNFRPRKFIIEHLDSELQCITRKDISDALNERDFEIQDVLRLNDRLLILSTNYERESEHRLFFIQEINYNTLTLGQRVEIYRFKTSANAYFETEFFHAPGEQKILFSVIPEKRVPLIRKQENDYRELVLLNRDLTVHQRIGKLDMRVKGVDFSIVQTLVNDSGDLYFLAQKIPDKKSEEPDYYVLKYAQNTLISQILNFKEGKIKRARIEMNPNGQVLIMGYFGEIKRFNPGVGVFTAVLNADSLQVEKLKSELIRNEVLMVGLPDRQKRKWLREIQAGRDLKLDNDIVPLFFIRHPSGQVSMIGEIQYVNVESTSFAQSGSMQRFTYNYEHLFVTRVDVEGNILWTSKIPKLYRSNIDLIQSFLAIGVGENIHLFFNDNLDNLQPNPKKGTRYLSGRARFNFVANFSVDSLGKTSNIPLLKYNTQPFERIEMLNMFTDAAISGNQHLLFITSSQMKYRYLLASPLGSFID